MGLSDVAEKLAKYRTRLAAGQTERIKPAHVDKIIDKLSDKRQHLSEDLARRTSGQGRALLQRRIAKLDELIEQAHWLRREIEQD